MSDEDVTFEGDDAGGSLTFSKQCSTLNKNGYVVIEGRPCKITDIKSSKDSGQTTITGLGVFTGKKHEASYPSTSDVDVPYVNNREYHLVSVDDNGFLTLMTDDGDEMKEDVRIPDGGLGEEIRKLKEVDEKETMVTVRSSMGEEHVVAAKEVPRIG